MSSTLMIVEDHLLMRRTLRELLQKWFPSLDIIEAGDVPEALQFAAAHSPEVILMDIHLPGGSGLHATRRIKDDLPGTTVIVCTSETCDLYRKAAFESGASHFIPKNELASSNLQSVIEAAINSARALGQESGKESP
jgi:DNA-binding NarL/FixJ family response regulator